MLGWTSCSKIVAITDPTITMHFRGICIVVVGGVVVVVLVAVLVVVSFDLVLCFSLGLRGRCCFCAVVRDDDVCRR